MRPASEPSSLGPSLRATGAKRTPKGIYPVYRYDAEEDRNRLLEPDGPRNGRAAEDNGSQQAELDAVRLPLLDAIPARAVCLCQRPRR